MTTLAWVGVFVIIGMVCVAVYAWRSESFSKETLIGVSVGILFGLIIIYSGSPSLQVFVQGK